MKRGEGVHWPVWLGVGRISTACETGPSLCNRPTLGLRSAPLVDIAIEQFAAAALARPVTLCYTIIYCTMYRFSCTTYSLQFAAAALVRPVPAQSRARPCWHCTTARADCTVPQSRPLLWLDPRTELRVMPGAV